MEDKEFPLDDVAQEFMKFRVIDKQYKEAGAWLDKYKKLLKQVCGDANQFTLKGKPVAVLVPGKLNETLLAKEQPAIIDEYTELVTVRQFNKARFAEERPEMFEQYRAQGLKLTGE